MRFFYSIVAIDLHYSVYSNSKIQCLEERERSFALSFIFFSWMIHVYNFSQQNWGLIRNIRISRYMLELLNSLFYEEIRNIKWIFVTLTIALTFLLFKLLCYVLSLRMVTGYHAFLYKYIWHLLLLFRENQYQENTHHLEFFDYLQNTNWVEVKFFTSVQKIKVEKITAFNF